jgi:hypothetical protein
MEGEGEFSARSDRSGAFELRGRATAPRLVLSASHADYASSPAAEVARGATGVVLALDASGTIAGRLLLDEAVPFPSIELVALDARGEAADVNTAVESGGRFAIRGLHAGTYSVVARLHDERGELARVDGIAAEPLHTTEDPALDPLDLRGKVRHFALLVVDGEGKRIRWLQTQRRMPGESEFGPRREWGGRESLAIVTAASALDLRVSASGYRTTEIVGVDSDRTVTLETGIPLELAFGPELIAFDREHSTGVMLRSASGAEEDQWVDVDGEHAAPIVGSPGRYRLTFFAEREDDWVEFGQELDLAIEVADERGPQAFTVTLSPAAIEDARRQLRG